MSESPKERAHESAGGASAASTVADETRDAGRGVLTIAGAKAYFMVAGAVIEFSLPSILGATVFGAYAVVASTVSPVNNVLITGTIQTLSRFTAQARERARAVQRTGLRMQLAIGLPVAVAFLCAAPLLAGFFHDRAKVGPLALAAAIVAGYAVYAVFIGTANGLRQFDKQAGLDVTMATLRAAGIVGLAAAGFGLYGAIGGWVAATLAILALASLIVGWPGRTDAAAPPQPLAPMASYFGSVALFLILLNLIMFVDQILLKRLGAEWFATHPAELHDWLAAHDLAGADTDAARAADTQVGYYRAVQNLARLSYQAILAVTFVIFPLISRATFADDRATTQLYVRTTLRYALIFAAAIAVVFAANPHAILDVPYQRTFADHGARALIALALGNVAFSILAIIGAVLNSAGRTRDAIALAAVTLAVAAAANWLAIPRVAPGKDALLACASATAGAMLMGAGLGSAMLARAFGASFAPATLLRVTLAGATAIGFGRVVPFTSPLLTLVEAAAVGGLFLGVLIVTGELRAADARSVVRTLRGKRGAAGEGGGE
jgi:O-antigen/teichoic acid export membrane protein